VDGLNDKIRESLGLEASLKGTQDERNKLLREQESLSAKLAEIEALRAKGGLSAGQLQALGQTEASVKRQMGVVRDLSREWNAVSDATKLADSVTASLGDTLNTLDVEGVEHAAGSINALTAELEGLQAQFEATASGTERADLSGKIGEIEERITVLRSVLKPVVTELKMLNEMGMAGDDGFSGADWDSQYQGVKIFTDQMKLAEGATFLTQQASAQFVDSFSAGLANVIMLTEKWQDSLRNIGKFLLSSAIQTAIKLLLVGTSGFGVKGGSTGLLSGLFKPQVAAVPTGVMGAGTMSVSGSFKVQGTDLIAVINRSERQLR
jgi:hypothetical protein